MEWLAEVVQTAQFQLANMGITVAVLIGWFINWLHSYIKDKQIIKSAVDKVADKIGPELEKRVDNGLTTISNELNAKIDKEAGIRREEIEKDAQNVLDFISKLPSNNNVDDIIE